MLRIRAEREVDLTILICVGRVVAGEECRLLWSAVLYEEAREVILDFTAVSGMDAAGLGTLMALHHRLTKKESRLILAKVGSRLSGLLALTQLDTVLNLRQNDNRQAQVHSHAPVNMPTNFLGCCCLTPSESSRQSDF